MDSSWTNTAGCMPTKNARIEWISPGGQHEKGKWLGGAVWMPENSTIYVYYTPVFWRYI